MSSLPFRTSRTDPCLSMNGKDRCELEAGHGEARSGNDPAHSKMILRDGKWVLKSWLGAETILFDVMSGKRL